MLQKYNFLADYFHTKVKKWVRTRYNTIIRTLSNRAMLYRLLADVKMLFHALYGEDGDAVPCRFAEDVAYAFALGYDA